MGEMEFVSLLYRQIRHHILTPARSKVAVVVQHHKAALSICIDRY